MQSNRWTAKIHMVPKCSSSICSSPVSLAQWRVNYRQQYLHRNYTLHCEQCTWYLSKPKTLPEASISKNTAILDSVLVNWRTFFCPFTSV